MMQWNEPLDLVKLQTKNPGCITQKLSSVGDNKDQRYQEVNRGQPEHRASRQARGFNSVSCPEAPSLSLPPRNWRNNWCFCLAELQQLFSRSGYQAHRCSGSAARRQLQNTAVPTGNLIQQLLLPVISQPSSFHRSSGYARVVPYHSTLVSHQWTLPDFSSGSHMTNTEEPAFSGGNLSPTTEHHSLRSSATATLRQASQSPNQGGEARVRANGLNAHLQITMQTASLSRSVWLLRKPPTSCRHSESGTRPPTRFSNRREMADHKTQQAQPKPSSKPKKSKPRPRSLK